jgi:hypothetical protein
LASTTSAAAASSNARAAESARRAVDAMVDEAVIVVSLASFATWRPSYGRAADPNISCVALVV